MIDTLHYLLWAYFLLYPLYIYLTINQDKQAVANNPNNRIKVYQSTIVYLWLPTLLLGYLVFISDLTLNDIGLRFSSGFISIAILVVSLLICGYLLLSLKTIKNYSEEQVQQTKQQLAHVSWLMPQTQQQKNWMVFGVSSSAGICEELLFRGYLIYQLGLYVNDINAVIISSIAFGLGHIYQGWQHVIRTVIMGAVFAGIYIASDSLIAPIILHIVVDAFGGQLAYLLNIQTVKSEKV